MEAIWQKAQEVGRLLAQTTEYKALKTANERLSDDRDTVATLNRLTQMQDELTEALRRGEEPTAEQQEEYQTLVEGLQQRSVYQGMVSAQENFDRLMMRINEEIGRGIEMGEKSRIILSS